MENGTEYKIPSALKVWSIILFSAISIFAFVFMFHFTYVHRTKATIKSMYSNGTAVILLEKNMTDVSLLNPGNEIIISNETLSYPVYGHVVSVKNTGNLYTVIVLMKNTGQQSKFDLLQAGCIISMPGKSLYQIIF